MVMMMRHAYRHVCRGTSGRNWEFMGFFPSARFCECRIALVRYAVLLRSVIIARPV